ncbi:MAG TPA: hypothetical protein VKH43_08520 [Thermoanaerobaculia bacterium]|nr:hypothetical protein [Thermoanaerobaculia bacterium]
MRKGWLGWILTLGGLVAAPGAAGAQEATVERLFADVLHANRYALVLEGGRLTGPGAAFLVREGGKGQFLLLGEDHNVAEIPRLTAALFAELHAQHGYDYLADEQDLWMCSEISKPPYLGREEQIRALRAKYRNAFTFEGDEEVAMLADIGRISTAKVARIWGLDQIFGALHVLERLEAIAADDSVRGRVRALVDFARPYESGRYVPGKRLMSEVELPEDLVTIPTWYRARAKDSAEGAFLADQLGKSVRIYANWRHAAIEKQPTGYESNREREENMKDLFLRYYRDAERRDGRLPKVLFKFGHWHLYRGQSPGSVFTLGNFASEFAKSNASSSFAAAIYQDDGPGSKKDWSSWAPWARPFIEAEFPEGWTVLDLRPLRSLAHARRLGTIPPELWRLLFGFEALILLKAAHPATLPP